MKNWLIIVGSIVGLAAIISGACLWSNRKKKQIVREVCDIAEKHGLTVEDVELSLKDEGWSDFTLARFMPAVRAELERRQKSVKAGLQSDLEAAGMTSKEAEAAVEAIASRTVAVLS